MTHVLDNLAWHALTGGQQHLGEVSGNRRAARYLPEVSIFSALDAEGGADSFAGMSELLGPEEPAILFRTDWLEAPAGWQCLMTETATQWVAEALPPAPELELVELGSDDRDEMMKLVEETEPGPFGPRTIEMGRYVGVRREGRLVAMAGERMRCPGWTEVSAVCAHPSVRRQGLGAALTLVVADRIRADGHEAVLHVREGNAAAQALYAGIGFRMRGDLYAGVFQPVAG